MTTQQNTLDKITGWATDKYTGIAPSLSSITAPSNSFSNPGLMSVATTAAPMTRSLWNTAADSVPGVATINPGDLATRTVDKGTETVQGQLGGLLAENSQVLQQAKADSMRTAFDRGLGNSAMAASGGTDALLRSATTIAATDAGTYGKANDYNTAATNQAVMWNGEQKNQFALAERQLEHQREQQRLQLEQQQEQQRLQQEQAMKIAAMNDATQRWSAEQSTANSRYNTDLAYKKDVDNQKLGVANNIIANMELSPDRKAAMLQELGFGSMAVNGQAGTGLAGAVFVLDSVGSELTQGGKGSYTGNLAQTGKGGGTGYYNYNNEPINIHNQYGTVGGD